MKKLRLGRPPCECFHISIFYNHPGALALGDSRDITLGRAFEELSRTPDLVLRVTDHFVELGNPADRTRQRENRGEQGHWNADGTLHDA